MNRASVEYKGKKYTQYQIDQKQRYIERQIRKYKRRAKLEKDSGLDDSKSVSFVKKWQLKLREFIKETRNRREYSREYVESVKYKKDTVKHLVKKQKVWKENNVKDVTHEYLENAISNKAKVKFEEGYIFDDSSESDIEFAEWVQKTFGGKITLTKKRDIKYPDYWWERDTSVSLWEKKKIYTKSSIANRIEVAIEQLYRHQERGGFLFDARDNPLSKEEIISRIKNEFYQKGRSRLAGLTYDVIIRFSDEIIVFRMKQ